jgi:transcriptional regulator of arginine metabolism
MNQERRRRQRAIVHLLRESGPRSAHDIAAWLADGGFDITQAMIARDLEQIGAVKVKRQGKIGYSLPEKLGKRDQATERLGRIFAEWVHAVDTSGSMVVVRTPPGSAHLVALAVDQARFPEIVGTIAGDDALFIAIRDGLPSEPLALRLRDLIGNH